MTTISSEVILHSVAEGCPPNFTLKLRYPRWIHAESETHRVLSLSLEVIDVVTEPGLMSCKDLSRNAGSSRAKPTLRLIEEAENDYAIPLHWGKAQSGMQAMEELTGRELDFAKDSWHRSRLSAVAEAKIMMALGVAKQNINRILEPYTHIDVVVTSTEWANFFALRDHPHAEPHFQILAKRMRESMAASTPQTLTGITGPWGGWHLPYVDERTLHEVSSSVSGDGDRALDLLRKVSTARCARVSYRAYDGTHSPVEKDVELHDSLAKNGHWSPFEHQATPDSKLNHRGPDYDSPWTNPDKHGNLRGWAQYRKTFPNESGVRAR